MKILILDTLWSQISKRQIPDNVMPRLYNELETLATFEDKGLGFVKSYIKKKNGKKFKGMSDDFKICKFQLTGGDRLLYTYGKYLPYIPQKLSDSIVLLSYAKHDNQGSIAKGRDFEKKKDYLYLKKIVEDFREFTSEDEKGISSEELYTIASIISSNDSRVYVLSDKELNDYNPDDIDRYVLLSEEQGAIVDEYSKDNKPTLIMGGAGTGKTLIAVRMLHEFTKNECNQRRKAIYFTQSEQLRNKVNKQYDSLSNGEESENNVYFFDINDFCVKGIKNKSIGKKNIVKYNQFLKFFKNGAYEDECRKIGIDPLDVWTEIRGTIKGSMDENWQRVKPLSQDDYNGVKALIDKDYCHRKCKDKKLFMLGGTVKDIELKAQEDKSLGRDERKLLQRITKYFSAFDSTIRMIQEDEYYGLSDERTVLSKEQRKIVYRICEDYDDYLIQNNLFDENDLVREYILENDVDIDRYNFVTVDEVQDYSELQLYLIYRICNNENGLIFAGDIHQIVNPTLFDVSRLNALFRTEDGTAIEQKILGTNYRCQQGIVNIANKISELRRSVIGKKKDKLEQEERSCIEREISSPGRLKCTEENIIKALQAIRNYPTVAVLVPNEEWKSKLINKIGIEVYAESHPFIFTITEIKGMEYEYVFCYNIFGAYNSIWDDMLNSEQAYKKKTKYRYFFNVAYVAISRAQLHICFIDEVESEKLEKKLGLEQYDKFDLEALYFDTLKTDEEAWYRQAKALFENGSYREALVFFENGAKALATIEDIYKCKAGIAEEENDFETACKYNLLLKDEKKMNSNVKELDSSSYMKKIIEFCSGEPTKYTGIVDAIKKSFSSELFSEQEISFVNLFVLRKAQKILNEKMLEYKNNRSTLWERK